MRVFNSFHSCVNDKYLFVYKIRRMNTNKPILFFSKKCPNSEKLWSYMTQQRLLDSFIKICVDDLPSSKLPTDLRVVPSIYVKGQPMITGQAIPMYLNSVQNQSFVAPPRSSLQTMVVDRGQGQGGGQLPPHQPPTFHNTGSPNDFNVMEMSSQWSSCYEFIDTDQNQSYQNHFFSIGNENGMITQPSMQQKGGQHTVLGGHGQRPGSLPTQTVDSTKKAFSSETERRYQQLMMDRDGSGRR